MSENIEIGIHTEKSSKATLIRSIELMATQLQKFTFDNKAAVDKTVDVERQAKNYRMNLDQLQLKLQKLNEQIAGATPIIERMKTDHEICKEQHQEAKKQMLSVQLSVNNEEIAIHDLQNRMEMQKKNIQSIINRIGKMHKNSKIKEPVVKSSKGKDKKKKRESVPTPKANLQGDIQKSCCDKGCPKNKVKTKASITTEYQFRKEK